MGGFVIIVNMIAHSKMISILCDILCDMDGHFLKYIGMSVM